MGKGLVASSISIERGGVGVAIAKSSMAGMIGCEIDLDSLPKKEEIRNDTALFSESQGRLLVSVDPSKSGEFEVLFSGLPFAKIGKTISSGKINITGSKVNIINTDVKSLLKSHKSLFDRF